MGKKRTPQTPLQYAAYLYAAERCDGSLRTLSDTDIINSRMRAFMDGVNWERRRRSRNTGDRQ
jgi:hypothetical protein